MRVSIQAESSQFSAFFSAGRLIHRRAMAGLLVLLGAAAQGAPALCGNAAPAPYPARGLPPQVAIWSASQPQLGAGPLCAGLRTRDFALLVGVTGRFASAASAEALLARVGAVSALKGVTYWSQHDRRREVLITDAVALDGLVKPRRRADFSSAELAAGQPLYFEQHDNRATTAVIYQLRVRELAPTGWSVSLENASAVKVFLATLFEPGDVQTVISVQQIAPGEWGYRSLTGLRRVGVGQVDSFGASYVNRALAMFEHLSRP